MRPFSSWFLASTFLANSACDIAIDERVVEPQSRPHVVGNLAYIHDSRAKTITFLDARSGRVLRVTDDGWGQNQPVHPYIGIPIWASNRRRLFIIGQDDKPNDVKDVVEMVGDGWQPGKRVWLSDYAMGFERVVGNPDTGPFAVFESNNRATYMTGLFRRDLSRIKTDALDVFDIGPLGILAIRGKRDGLQNIESSELICIDPKSGEIIWRNTEHFKAKWEGNRVRAGKVLLDGRTGKELPPLTLK